MAREPRKWEDVLYDVLEFLIDDQSWIASDSNADHPGRAGWPQRARLLAAAGWNRLFRRRGPVQSFED